MSPPQQHQPHLNPHQASPKKTALTQALTCTTCTYPPPHLDNLYNDMTTGKYDFLRDPPFSSPSLSLKLGEEDEISPLDNTILPPETGYGDIMTDAQRGRYGELVLGGISISGVISEFTTRSGGTGTGREGERGRQFADDLKTEVLLRFYQVDYHIHLHYLSGRSVLALCRDVADVHSLRRWRWDIMTSSETERGRDRGKRQKQNKRMRSGGWTGWPVDNPEMLDLVALWRKRWQERRERVDLVRAKWVWIMEERRVQRARVVRLTQGEVQW